MNLIICINKDRDSTLTLESRQIYLNIFKNCELISTVGFSFALFFNIQRLTIATNELDFYFKLADPTDVILSS